MSDPVVRVKAEFAARFPGEPRVFRAPGRVNLIGEHTDYNLGFVLPVALELACYAASAPSPDGRWHFWAADLAKLESWSRAELEAATPRRDWTDYCVGVARQLLAGGHPIEPRAVAIHSRVPLGGGLSSSAALEVASALALLDGAPISGLELARVCRRAENEFVGMPCGIMDQYISVFGQRQCALLIDCRDQTYQAVPLPAEAHFVAVNSMVKHELGQSAYRERVAECQAAATILGVASLRDARPDSLAGLTGKPLLRARHVTTEDERVGQFISAAAQGDLAWMGSLMVASHASLRDDYEVSCDELDFLVETALAVEGVWGARMTGGGFGGCTVNLMRADREEAFRSQVAARYQARFGREPRFYPCRPASGAGPARD